MAALGIKEKLRELERVQKRLGTARPRKSVHTDLNSLLGGEERDGCFVVERRHEVHESYGPVRLADFLGLSSAALGIVAKDAQLLGFAPQQALFIDTETTGLAGGTGTLAFLVGLGYFENDTFVVRQYFVRGPQEEAAMLMAVQRHVQQCHGLVTFNGKSFDLPLLVTRSILNRQRPFFDALPHIDVLHAARRMWKQRWQDCSLGNLEHRVLGKTREIDVPGALIPTLYFDFLRTGNTQQLPEILAHNRQDIVTTAALLTYLGALVQSPFKQQASSHELRQIGKLYREAGEWESSAQLLQALLADHAHEQNPEDYLALGFCHKSRRHFEEAVQVWRHMIENLPFHPLPFIELAKHLEHRGRAHHEAHELTQRALAQLQKLQPAHAFLVYQEDLQRRITRLQRKLNGEDPSL